jgi:TonB family protein
MPYFLDMQETAQRFGDRILELRSLFGEHYVAYGSPDDFIEFAEKLEENYQFRIDLSALTKDIAQKEGGELLLTDMMSIIAAAVGGPTIAETPRDITRPSNSVMEFLLGTGCWKHFGAPAAPPSPRSQERSSTPASATRPGRNGTDVSNSETTGDAPQDRAPIVDISSQLSETLARLETNTQQFKLHLDSIERRIGEMEPHLVALPVHALAAPQQPEPQSGPYADIAHLDAEKSLIPNGVQPIHAGDAAPFKNRAGTAVPIIIAQASAKKSSAKSRIAILALLVVAVSALILTYAAPGQEFLQAASSKIQSVVAGSTSVSTVVRPVPPVARAATSSPSIPASPARAAASPPANTHTRPSMAARTTPILPPDSPDYSVVRISPIIMERNLISAPPPAYPRLARLAHVQGRVALQATISRSGSIEDVHVIDGPHLLRGAAVNAARKWRYKPYIIGGSPVAVDTTINVDFSSKRSENSH